jgi:hypothetical protein
LIGSDARRRKRVAALELARGDAKERLLERNLLGLRVRIADHRDPETLGILRARVLDVAQAVAVDRDVGVSLRGPPPGCAGPQHEPAARVGRIEDGKRDAEHAQRDLGQREREHAPSATASSAAASRSASAACETLLGPFPGVEHADRAARGITDAYDETVSGSSPPAVALGCSTASTKPPARPRPYVFAWPFVETPMEPRGGPRAARR